MRIVAQQGAVAFLVTEFAALPQNYGVIIDIQQNKRYAPLSLSAIYARGYWTRVESVPAETQAKILAILQHKE